MAEAKNVRYGNVSSTLTVAPLREKGLYGFRRRASPSMSKEGLNCNFLHRGLNNYFTMIRSSRTADKRRRALM